MRCWSLLGDGSEDSSSPTAAHGPELRGLLRMRVWPPARAWWGVAGAGRNWLAIVTWIETKYHHRRRLRGLGKLTRVVFETIYAAADAA